MDIITLRDFEVFYHIGVPDEERVHAQRLLISVEMETDITMAAAGDDLNHTINYYAVGQRLQQPLPTDPVRPDPILHERRDLTFHVDQVRHGALLHRDDDQDFQQQ